MGFFYSLSKLELTGPIPVITNLESTNNFVMKILIPVAKSWLHLEA